MPYDAGIAIQRAQRDRLLMGERDAAGLLLCEHEPVITLGRHATTASILVSDHERAAAGVALARADRGGDATYHGPGQLMVYPVIRLTGSMVGFLSAMAEALAETAAELGVPGAAFSRDPAGLWLGPHKLAACGLHLHRRVSTHGFALNVATPPEMWRLIIPCGLRDRGVTSLASERAARGLGPPPPIEQVAALAAPRLCAALARFHRL